MSKNIVHGLPDVVYSLICDNPGVFKYYHLQNGT